MILEGQRFPAPFSSFHLLYYLLLSHRMDEFTITLNHDRAAYLSPLGGIPEMLRSLYDFQEKQGGKIIIYEIYQVCKEVMVLRK